MKNNIIACPGFVDLQVNGAVGVDFNRPDDLSAEALEEVCRYQWANGVGKFLLTIISNPNMVIEAILVKVAEAIRKNKFVKATLAGVHLEIYVSPNAAGCHNPQYFHEPEWDFISGLGDSGDLIHLITVAPELPGALNFIEQAYRAGKKMAIGHTMADYDTLLTACCRGAALSTHLGNGVPQMLPRNDNPVSYQLGMPGLFASFIADLHHLSKSALLTYVGIKGIDHSIIITDSIFAAGLMEARCRLAGQPIVVKEGKAFLVSQPEVLAGSVVSMLQSFTNLQVIGFSFSQIIAMMSCNPIRLMGWEEWMRDSELLLDVRENGPMVKRLIISGLRVI